MNKKERFCDVDNIVEWRHIITALLALVVFVSCSDEEEPVWEQQTERHLLHAVVDEHDAVF